MEFAETIEIRVNGQNLGRGLLEKKVPAGASLARAIFLDKGLGLHPRWHPHRDHGRCALLAGALSRRDPFSGHERRGNRPARRVVGTSCAGDSPPNLDAWHILVSHLGVAIVCTLVGLVTGLTSEIIRGRSVQRGNKTLEHQ